MTTSTKNEILASKLGLQIKRAAFLALAGVAFGFIVYAGTVLGFDLPTWRMNGEESRMYPYLFGCIAAFVLVTFFGTQAEKLKHQIEEMDEFAEVEEI